MAGPLARIDDYHADPFCRNLVTGPLRFLPVQLPQVPDEPGTVDLCNANPLAMDGSVLLRCPARNFGACLSGEIGEPRSDSSECSIRGPCGNLCRESE